MSVIQQNTEQGLYSPDFEHDNCGIGAVVNIKGQKSHDTVANALKIVENLEHRAGKDAEGKTGDGVGILLQVSHRFFSKVCKPLGIFLGSERDYGVGMFFFPQDTPVENRPEHKLLHIDLVLFFADDDDRAGAFFGAAADITAIGSVKHFHKGSSKF